MPILSAGKKAMRQSKKHRAHNLIYKQTYKGLLKQVRGLVEEGKQKEAIKLLPQLYRALDKSAKINILTKNTASRYKSRIIKLIARAKPS